MTDADNPDDGLAALIAAIDQMVAGAPQIARAARGWFDAFQAEGFTPKEALYLTAAELLQDPGRAP